LTSDVTAIFTSYAPPPLFERDIAGDVCYSDLPHRWYLISGAGSGSKFHVDPLNSSACKSFFLFGGVFLLFLEISFG